MILLQMYKHEFSNDQICALLRIATDKIFLKNVKLVCVNHREHLKKLIEAFAREIERPFAVSTFDGFLFYL